MQMTPPSPSPPSPFAAPRCTASSHAFIATSNGTAARLAARAEVTGSLSYDIYYEFTITSLLLYPPAFASSQEDEQLQDLLRCLPDAPETYERVMEAIWRVSAGQGQGQGAAARGPPPRSPGLPGGVLERRGTAAVAASLGVGVEDLPGSPLTGPLFAVELRESVIRTVKAVFEAHGAVAMSSRQLGLAHPELPADAVSLALPHVP